MSRLSPFGLGIIVSPHLLPMYPSPSEDARRIVRHGMADVLAWLGEEVGPKPGEAAHALQHQGGLLVSQELFDRLREQAS